jgi:DNA mismatch repair protein MutL
MGRIKILSQLIANKIAAGEVIERPASVIKELMENALDAEAKTVSVTVSHGGMSQMSVVDDGCGMDPDDAQACLLRHATSKISAIEDLERIDSLGFRGEALASIAAVSRLTLVTRPHAAATGTSIKASGGTIETIAEQAAAAGTSIDVADLFFNTPARKKFLKSEGAEYAAIADVFDTVALCFPRKTFSLYKNGHAVASYPACEMLRERIGQIHSPEFADHLHQVCGEHPDVKIQGYIGTPDNTRVNRSGQKFFINRRPIRSIGLSLALERAYEEFKERNRYPVAILFFEIDPAFVDVNIHPAKREVRILNERFIQDVLIRAVKKTLAENGIVSRPFPSDPESALYRDTAYPEPSRQLSFAQIRDAAARWKTPAQAEAREGERSFTFGNEPGPGRADKKLIEEDEYIPFGISRILGQVQNTYIIAEAADGLMLIDQHAAHERIIYEDILAGFREHPSATQRLLFPLTLHLDLKEQGVMENCLDEFQKIGFGINALGGGTFSIDMVPAFFAEEDSARVLIDVLHELMEENLSQSREKRQEILAAAIACKTRTVKAGARLDEREMVHLIRRLGKAQNPHTCPHGRPTMFTVSTAEIEKRFKRK